MGLKTRPSPPRTFTPEEAQQWFKLLEAIEEELGDSGLANTLFVDGVTGDNDTAQRGSLVFKYLTIQAALDAALAGDTVWITPGVYVEDLTWPDTNNITLKGTSNTSTQITNDTAVDTITIAPTVPIALANIIDTAISNTDGQLGINVDGTADEDMFDGFFNISDVIMLTGLTMQSVNKYELRNIQAKDTDLTIVDCGPGISYTSEWDNITASYAAAPATAPAIGRGDLRALATIVKGTLTVNTLASVLFSKDSEIRTIAGDLIDTAADVGYIQALGYITGNIDVTFDLQNADSDIITCDFAKIGGTVTVADVGTSTFRGGANFRSAELLDQNGPHTAGDACDMDLRGALFNQASLAVAGDGTIDRSVWVQTILGGNSATPVPWANGGGVVPYPSAPDYVGHECNLAAEMPVAITTKSATQVAYTKGGAGDGANVVVCAIRDYVA